ncbi:pre-mRNA-splicing regulator female-lethal(2)D [Bacillus rossius redtenbacheri]|uniref:pre-mRNA-splicing regulator female-lethal(2)D n=1 Tax=Bacillus rossius redtenbacheri TaxID=93214 RepID=UPI002FDC967E
MSEDTNPPAENAAGTPLAGKQPRRQKFTEQQLAALPHEELAKSWQDLDMYADYLEAQLSAQEGETAAAREAEERVRQQHLESAHREKVLVRRLATKEQETQEYVSQIAELKAAQAPGAVALRSALLDPAVNLCLQRLAQQLAASRAKVEETQNELSAWKFTPDSNTGKRLMAKCRLLYQENEDLGRMVSSGRLAKLEGELALQKSFSEEVKKSQSELDEFLQELDEDVEGMQGTIYYLQQELRRSKEAAAALQAEVAALKGAGASVPPPEAPPPPAAPPVDEDSSGSAELILKVAADELGADGEFEAEAGPDPPADGDGERKRPLVDCGDSSGDDSDNVPLIKKVRRDSEISLHYDEDEDEDEETRLMSSGPNDQGNAPE